MKTSEFISEVSSNLEAARAVISVLDDRETLNNEELVALNELLNQYIELEQLLETLVSNVAQ